MTKPVCIVWMNEAHVYEQALACAGLADRVEFHGVRVGQTIPAELAARGEMLVGWRPAPGLIAGMPRLRWIQSTTAGMDQWLASPDLRDDIINLTADPAHDPPGSRSSPGEEEASMNIRPIMRTLRARSHLLPARGLGEPGSRLD